MTQTERVRQIRKSLNLTMEKFGECLGVTKTAISLIESGKNNLTEANIKSICREFNVNYTWLANGEGEIFTEDDSAFMKRIDRIMSGEGEERKNLFKALLEASDEDIAAFQRIINLFSKQSDGGK